MSAVFLMNVIPVGTVMEVEMKALDSPCALCVGEGGANLGWR